MRRWPLRCAGLLLVPTLASAAFAQASTGTARDSQPARAGSAAAQPARAPAITPIVSWRTRGEQWAWFTPQGVAGNPERYAFLGSLLRAGLTGRHGFVGWTVEASASMLAGLPDDAALPAPQGQLGFGGTYNAANEGKRGVASVFPKQLFVRLGAPASGSGTAVRLGRFEVIDGAELAPANATLAAVKRDRVAHRLLGNFGWTHAQRSFDGVQLTHTRRGNSPWDATLLAAFPVEGVFRVNAWRPLDAGVIYGAYTAQYDAPFGANDARVFALHYRDWRDVPPVDSRPAAARAADRGVTVTSVGAHWLLASPTPAGTIDVLLWGVLQTGRWGLLDHRANALALEGGIQPPILAALRPWLRVGWFRGSGDPSTGDDTHETFFQVLPTPRVYARFPFFDAMNSDDVFGSLILRPGSRTTVRADVHRLRLTERADLWYVGGGAFENAPSFGYTGRASGGASDLATLADLSVEVRATPRIGVTLYGARAGAGDVVRGVYPGSGPAWLGYLELELRR